MAYRYAFGDESGDPGFTFDRGSSHYLVVLLLLLDDPEPLRDRVDRLRQQLELPPGIEFKFHKTSAANRRVFLAALQSHQFVGYALVVDKGQLSAGWRSASDVGFHALCFAELIGRIPARTRRYNPGSGSVRRFQDHAAGTAISIESARRRSDYPAFQEDLAEAIEGRQLDSVRRHGSRRSHARGECKR